MRKVIFLLSFTIAFAACSHKIEPSEVAKMNGYWEIEHVVLANGEKKDYAINETYDYFEINGKSGSRTKVMPQLDGTFLTNGISEQLKIVTEKGETFIAYKTDYATWREQLLEVTDTELVLLNPEKNEYHYKKTGPINLKADGQKTP